MLSAHPGEHREPGRGCRHDDSGHPQEDCQLRALHSPHQRVPQTREHDERLVHDEHQPAQRAAAASIEELGDQTGGDAPMAIGERVVLQREHIRARAAQGSVQGDR